MLWSITSVSTNQTFLFEDRIKRKGIIYVTNEIGLQLFEVQELKVCLQQQKLENKIWCPALFAQQFKHSQIGWIIVLNTDF